MEKQTGTHTRKIGKTAFAIGLKPANNAKSTLEAKLERMIQKENSDNAKTIVMHE